MHQDDEMFEYIFSNYGKAPGQREASVVASFVCWLGTNVGMSYLSEGARLSEQFYPGSRYGYLAAWAVHNTRCFFTYGALRAIEVLLTPKGTPPTVSPSIDDYECIELIARWIGTEKGQTFIKSCEQEDRRTSHVLSHVSRPR